VAKHGSRLLLAEPWRAGASLGHRLVSAAGVPREPGTRSILSSKPNRFGPTGRSTYMISVTGSVPSREDCDRRLKRAGLRDRMRLGRVGVWSGAFGVAPAATARPVAREIDELGYDTLWYGEGLGTRESFTNGAVLLGATDRIRVASGIANIWGRDPVNAA